MSVQYDQYLMEHKANVVRAFIFLKEHLPHLIEGDYDYEWQISIAHDQSKDSQEEYDAYDKYFYGPNKSYQVVQNFNKAWLHHIHNNPHHWQHWVLINDDTEDPKTTIEMPYNYIIEMICDWWSFSWKTGDLKSIFTWYDEHPNIQLHPDSKKIVEHILDEIKKELEKENV